MYAYTCNYIHIQFIHTYIYVHMYIHIHIYMYLHVCVYIYMYLHVCVYIYIYIYLHVYVHTLAFQVHIRMHLCVPCTYVTMSQRDPQQQHTATHFYYVSSAVSAAAPGRARRCEGARSGAWRPMSGVNPMALCRLAEIGRVPCVKRHLAPC